VTWRLFSASITSNLAELDSTWRSAFPHDVMANRADNGPVNALLIVAAAASSASLAGDVPLRKSVTNVQALKDYYKTSPNAEW
jgi:hypothetical protein